MPKSIISEGKTTNEAIEKGLKELKVSKNSVEIKVLEEKKKTFFDILAPNVVRVELTVKEGAVQKEEPRKTSEPKEVKEVDVKDLEEGKEKLEKFIKEFIAAYDSSITYDIRIEDNSLFVKLEGEAANVLIGYRGATLNSMQTIFRSVANKGSDANIKVIVDIDNYLDSRRKTLEDLPMVGRKTVSVVLAELFDEPSFAVDTHVYRVSKRLGITNKKDDVLKTETKLKKYFDKDTWNRVNQQLVLFGRYYCTSKRPKCETCNLKNICK